VDLGDGVLGPTPGPIPVARRVEVGFEDRFQDQLEGHLRDPVPQGGDAELAEFPALLRDRHLPHRQRAERAVAEGTAQLLQEWQHSDVLFDVAAGDRIHAGCPGAPVARDPLPRHQQGGLVADQVEHVGEPPARVASCPSVQLALVIEYPTLRPVQGRLVQNTAVQRLSSPLALLITLPPFPMHAAFLRSEYYGGSATTRCPQWASHLPTNPLEAGWEGQHQVVSHVH
jgi:hypothetical protein